MFETNTFPSLPLSLSTAMAQVVQETPMSEIHFMFTMLRASHLFVTHFGRLVGVIKLNDLLKDALN